MKHKKLFITGMLCVLIGFVCCTIAYRVRGDSLLQYTEIRIGSESTLLLGRKTTNPFSGAHETYAPAGNFTNYRIEADMADIEIVKGEQFMIETWNMPALGEKDDTLIWSEKKEKGTYANTWRVQSKFAHNNFNARIRVTVPETFSTLEIENHLGTIALDHLSLADCHIEADLGDVEVKDCRFVHSAFDLAMGSFDFEGMVKKRMKVDCAMGDADLVLQGKPEDYTIEADCDMGDVDIDGKESHPYHGDAHVELDMSMGSVDIGFEE